MPNIYDAIKASLWPVTMTACGMMAASAAILLIHGWWGLLWLGTALFLASSMLFPFIMLPAGFLSGAAQLTARVAPRWSRFFELMVLLWLISALSYYSAFSFSTVDGLFATPLRWPALAYGLSAAVAPWLVFAHRDRENMLLSSLVLMMCAGGLAIALLNAQDLAMTNGVRFLASSAVMTALLGLQFLQEERRAKKMKEGV